ncbi:MAG: hypothetical protein KAH25_03720 [Bacteroidales bacterium]|nr:hypothetical protein [Bacteroidales bacterium]
MKALTRDYFSKLTKTEQVVLVINNGEFIIKRQTKNFDISLFTIEDLLVEVWYKHESENIVKVKITEIENVTNNYSNLNNELDKIYHTK